MDTLRQYILAVICAAVACSMSQQLIDKQSEIYPLIKLVSGLVMVLVVFQPLRKQNILFWENYLSDTAIGCEVAVNTGKEQAKASASELITQKTQAYILNKAAQMGADISVQVTLGDGELPVPVVAQISGAVSPYVRQYLSEVIETELGIDGAHIIWS